MAVDPKFKGKKYPISKYEVGLEKVKEYATACGDLNPLYVNEDEAAKVSLWRHRSPANICSCLCKGTHWQIAFDSELGLNLPMLVHGEQEFEFFDVARPGDVIMTEGEILDIYEKVSDKGALDFVVAGTTSRRKKDNKIICKGKWTFVIRR
jgi:acyl dehydratase